MNKIEQGIANNNILFVNMTISGENHVLDKTWTEIVTAFNNGSIPIIITNLDSNNSDYTSGKAISFVTSYGTDEVTTWDVNTDSGQQFLASSVNGILTLVEGIIAS